MSIYVHRTTCRQNEVDRTLASYYYMKFTILATAVYGSRCLDSYQLVV